jgi:hypothetical protein
MAKKKKVKQKKVDPFSTDNLIEEIKKLAAKPDISHLDLLFLADNMKHLVRSQPLYIIEALRYGNREGHSYIFGVYPSYKKAVQAALEHNVDRAGKYTTEIHRFDFKHSHNDKEWQVFWPELYRVVLDGDKE